MHPPLCWWCHRRLKHIQLIWDSAAGGHTGRGAYSESATIATQAVTVAKPWSNASIRPGRRRRPGQQPATQGTVSDSVGSHCDNIVTNMKELSSCMTMIVIILSSFCNYDSDTISTVTVTVAICTKSNLNIMIAQHPTWHTSHVTSSHIQVASV